MLNLIDADLVGYRAAASCEPTKSKPFLEPLQVALFRLHDTVQTIIKGTNCNDCEFYIGGSDNFRKEIYPEYKANRTKPPPTYLQECRELLVVQYGASIVNGMETDDMLGIMQIRYEGKSRICSLDKDLYQIPGQHYQWEIRGTTSLGNIWVKPEEHRLVSPLDGLKTFYKQLIAGDGTDNIPSYDGKIRNSVPKFIEKLQAPIDEMTEELDMYNYCLDVYAACSSYWNDKHEEFMHRHAQLLYILKEEGKHWQPPNGMKQESETL